MAKKFPILPLHPERICWGCDKYCAEDSMMCGNGSVRTPHPSELFGEDWAQWECGAPAQDAQGAQHSPEAAAAHTPPQREIVPTRP
jgi:hypothetical protein